MDLENSNDKPEPEAYDCTSYMHIVTTPLQTCLDELQLFNRMCAD